MPRYFVGFDFGTHQTKICIKDTKTDPQSYKFVEFKTPDGKKRLMIPSVIQVNHDNTLIYGFVNDINFDDDNLWKFNKEKPRLVLPPMPIFRVKKNNLASELLDLFKRLLGKQDEYDYNLEVKRWEEICEEVKTNYSLQLASWNKEKTLFTQRLENQKLHTSQSIRVRYFKQAVFNEEYAKHYTIKRNISPEKASIFYIAFILFYIEESIGNDFFLQMGIPSGKNREEFSKQSSKAYRILISANELKKQYHTKEEFLAARLEELLHFSSTKDEKDIENYEVGMQTVPEAYAGLSAIVKNHGLSKGGIHLHIDIGGGTTDIALFTLGEEGDEAEIYSVTSFYKGLNFIIENSEFRESMSNNSKLKLFNDSEGEDSIFNNAINQYLNDLDEHLNNLINDLKYSFQQTMKGLIPLSALCDAIIYQPRVYCGGGSMYNKLLNSRLKYFIDKRVLTKETVAPWANFDNGNVKINKIFPLLVVAYGLSEPVTFDKITQKANLEELFKQLRGKMDGPEDYIQDYSKRLYRDYDD